MTIGAKASYIGVQWEQIYFICRLFLITFSVNKILSYMMIVVSEMIPSFN